MGLFSELREDIAEARNLENTRCNCNNTDSCVACCQRRIKIAELKGETPDIHDLVFLKMSGVE